MTQEEKYKQALERARQFSEHPLQEDSATIVEYIFPELAESEDEKIKREIVAYINELADLKNEKIPTKWLAWLEKQSEQPTAKVVDDAYLQGICDAKNELEKQDKKLDPDEVIAWLVANIVDFEHCVRLFKKDFKL